jgi:hypothetical protein
MNKVFSLIIQEEDQQKFFVIHLVHETAAFRGGLALGPAGAMAPAGPWKKKKKKKN